MNSHNGTNKTRFFFYSEALGCYSLDADIGDQNLASMDCFVGFLGFFK